MITGISQPLFFLGVLSSDLESLVVFGSSETTGASVGTSVGVSVGTSVGASVGASVAASVGTSVGTVLTQSPLIK